MKKVYFLFTLLSLLCFSCEKISAQNFCDFPCNDSLDMQPAFTCEDAQASAYNGSGPGFVCDFDGYCMRVDNIPPGNNAPFCNASACILNNPVWLSFVATSDFLNLDLCPKRCTGGGYQWALYDQCDNLLNAVDCHCTPVLSSDSIVNISVNVVPGQTYFLVLDGFSGAVCGFQFRVNDGLIGTPVGDLISDTLDGPAQVCKYKSSRFVSQGFHYASKYQWTLDGANIGGDSLTVDVNTDSMVLGAHTLCLNATNDCSTGEWKQHCWQFEVTASPESEVTGIACESGVFNFRGNDYAPGNYNLFFSDDDPATCDTVIHLNIIQMDAPHYPDVYLAKCIDQNTINYEGVDYAVSDSFYLLKYESNNGCDTLRRLFVKNMEISGEITSTLDSIPCENGVDTLTLDYSLSDLDSISTSTEIFWYGNTGDTLGHNTQQLIIHQAGDYQAQLLVTVNNPDGAARIVCEHWYSIHVPGSGEPLPIPELSISRHVCPGVDIPVAINNSYPPGTDFHWSIPGGQIQVANDGKSAIIRMDSSGVYTLCVSAESNCRPGNDTCMVLIAVIAPQIISFAQDSSGSLTGTLSASVYLEGGIIPSRAKYVWTLVSGPGQANIAQPDSLTTSVIVDSAGTYIFSLSFSYDGFITCTTTKELSFIFSGNEVGNKFIKDNTVLASQINLYPNPVSKLLFIQSEIPISNYEIIGPDGKSVLSGAYKQILDVSRFSPGVYLIRFTTERGKVIKKYIKK